MKKYFLIALIMLSVNLLNAQVEIPETKLNCSMLSKNNFYYCLDKSTYKVQWTATKILASDIKNNVYLPPDIEFFKNIPASIAPLWNKIEMQTKIWAMEFDSIYVVTGIKEETADSTTPAKTYYYKAILKGCQGDGLGFWVNTEEKSQSIKQVSVYLNDLEKNTEIDFFPTLDKDLQDIFEASFSWQFWPISIE